MKLTGTVRGSSLDELEAQARAIAEGFFGHPISTITLSHIEARSFSQHNGIITHVNVTATFTAQEDS